MKYVIALLLLCCMSKAQPAISALAQDSIPIRGPISAIRIDGDRLLLGQGSSLIEAKISERSVDVIRSIDLHHHEIRAITTQQNIVFVLTEDGLAALDNNGAEISFVRGGGQRIAVINGRVYIAALQAGVRVLTVDAAGKLAALGTFPTVGPARDIAPEINGLVWVAEVEQGIRLYDVQNITAVKPLTWVKSLAPATAVRINGTHVIVGHNGSLTTLDTLNPAAPRIVSTVALEPNEINDLIIAGNRAFVGMKSNGKGAAGADLLSLDLTTSQITAKVGSSGAGEWLAFNAKSNDLFIGSGRLGLRRLNVSGVQPAIVQAWEAIGNAQPCQLSAPALPQPANGDEVSGNTITLSWTGTCAATYEIRVNGELIGTTQDKQFSFTSSGSQNLLPSSWQIVAVDQAGQRVEGPTWTFTRDVQGLLATPASLPNPKLLYSPPVPIIDLNSPQQVLILTCTALFVGFIIVVVVAWYLGNRAEQRRLWRL